MEPANVVTEGAKLTPPAVVAILDWQRITLPDLVYILTAIYTVLLIANLVRKWLRQTPCNRDCPFKDND